MGTEENGEMSDWDPLVSMDQSLLHYPVLLHNQPMNTTSHLVHYQSNSNLVDILPKITSFENNAGFPEMISSFRVSDFHPNFTHNNMVATQEDCWDLEEVAGKRKSAESHTTKDMAADNSGCLKQEDGKKQKTENSSSLTTMLAGKELKDDSHYVHVRAKRGKATNSHSLAERVRREKISERMRLLQELVPGCNKITGKAVMLDEIINYVQSLQQQVEFLSMKLATVNPEPLSLDIEQAMSKKIFPTQGSNVSFRRLNPGISSYQTLPGIRQFHQQ